MRDAPHHIPTGQCTLSYSYKGVCVCFNLFMYSLIFSFIFMYFFFIFTTPSTMMILMLGKDDNNFIKVMDDLIIIV